MEDLDLALNELGMLSSVTKYNMTNDEIEFHSKIISIRKEGDGSRQVQLKWIPEDL